MVPALVSRRDVSLTQVKASMAAKPKYIAIVSRKGKEQPVYEADLSDEHEHSSSTTRTHLHQFVVHASLDSVDERIKQLTSLPATLGVVDRHTSDLVSAYATAGCARIVLLHKQRADSAVKAFFHEVHELYTKALLNPFASPSAAIFATKFDERVRAAARRFLSRS